jgi:lipoprotein-releasing system permease protein
MAATVISVAVMIVTVSLAAGFQDAVSEKIFSFWGHIRIQEKQPGKAIIAEEIPIKQNDSLITLLQQQPDVKSIHPFATRYALLKTKDAMEGLLIKGFDQSYDSNHLQSFIKRGRVPVFSKNSFNRELMVSTAVASRLQLQLNDSLLLYFVQQGETPRPRKVVIVGFYQTGIEDYDRLFAIGDLAMIRQLNNWDSTQVGGYEIYLHDPRNMLATSEHLYNLDEFPATWDAVTAQSISPQLFDWLTMQDLTRNVLIGFMTVVALINLITCLLILVLERIPMIGILKAIGASDWTVQKIFIRYSLLITLSGVIVGTLLALLILWLQQETGFIQLDEAAYFLDKAAVKIIPWQIAVIVLGTILISVAVLLVPSLLVRKIRPVRAIRFN